MRMEEKDMDSFVFRIVRRVCIVLFSANIFIHAVIGASSINGVLKGTLSMLAMLFLLWLLSKDDIRQRVKKDREERKKGDGEDG